MKPFLTTDKMTSMALTSMSCARVPPLLCESRAAEMKDELVERVWIRLCLLLFLLLLLHGFLNIDDGGRGGWSVYGAGRAGGGWGADEARGESGGGCEGGGKGKGVR